MKARPIAIGVFVSSNLIGKELEGIGKEEEDIFRLSYASLEEAIAIGRKHNQISVFGWKRKNLAYC